MHRCAIIVGTTKATKGARVASYETVGCRATAEIIEKKSRFIANIGHAASEDEALSFVASIREEHKLARHNVYAYLLRDGSVRCSDDGEPSRTAGMPALEVLRHSGLIDVVAVVTRYFGGTLLGTGGLVRAYTESTQAGLAAAERVLISSCIDIKADLPYPSYDQALYLAKEAGAKVLETDYTDRVLLTVRMLAGTESALVTQLKELLRGDEHLTIEGPFDATF